MKKNVTQDNFERFLKDNADELQMRPKAALWNRIERRLNRRRRWVTLTSAFFLATASVFGYLIVDQAKQPTDPFAGVQTIHKNPDGVIQTAPETTTATNKPATSQKASLSASAMAVTAAKNPDNSVNPTIRGQLFQNPIATTADAGLSNGDEAATNNTTPGFTPTPVDEYQPFEGTATKAITPQPQRAASYPLTIESVVNAYRPRPTKHKPEFQLYFTPTISYRRLTENKSYLRAVPQNLASYSLAALYDVNSMVTHKPDLGLELGFAFKFPITKHVKLRSGMQFNITGYDIKAFTYVPERTTITLNNRARGVDSLSTMSSYRNFNGGRADWLQNFYFQVSAPVGVEVAMNPKQKTRFGIAATIQPTYVLGDRAYLISSDYKNYSQVPWLIRHWNVNTSLETFVSYSTGKLRWQVGPQVRYQLLSSFVEEYPVKENLFNFGMKLGVSLDKK